MQRTRCGYFQDVTTPCNKREPGSGCSALDVYKRDHAILGASRACVATHPSDMAVALITLDALVQITGPDGDRSIPMAELHRLPVDLPQYDTILAHSDLITAVDLPALRVARNSKYRKVRGRASYAFALVSVAAALGLDDGTVTDVRIAFGGVAHKPWRARLAEEELRGGRAMEELFRRAAQVELDQAKPLRDNGFKIPMERNTLVSVRRELVSEATR